jgi:hypothetical protein
VEPLSVSVTGQTVVYAGTVTVVTTVDADGHSEIEEAQDITVIS